MDSRMVTDSSSTVQIRIKNLLFGAEKTIFLRDGFGRRDKSAADIEEN